MTRKVIFLLCIAVFLLFVLPITAQEVTPEATAIALTETYHDERGLILQYPSGWIVEPSYCESGLPRLWIANQESAYSDFLATRDDFGVDDVLIFIDLVPKVKLLSDPANVRLPRDLDMETLLRTSGLPAYLPQYAEYSTMTFNGHPAAQVWFRWPDYVDGYGLLFEADSGTLVMIAIYTYPGKRDDWKSTALAIAESLTYTPVVNPTPEPLNGNALALSETHTSENGHISFRLPTNWTAQSEIHDPIRGLDAEVIGITNGSNYEYVAGRYPNGLSSGKVNITIAVDHLYELIPASHIRDDFSFSETIDALTDIRTTALGLPCDPVAAQASMKIGGHDAVRFDTVSDKLDTIFLIIDYGDEVFGIVKTIAPHGELAQWLPTTLAIAESITYKG